MGLFSNTRDIYNDPLDQFDDMIFEFDAGSGTNQNADDDEELETIEDNEAQTPDDPDDEEDMNPDNNQDEELETMDDEGEPDQQEQEDQPAPASETDDGNQQDSNQQQGENDNQDNQQNPNDQPDDAGGGDNTNPDENNDEELETIDDDPDGMDQGGDGEGVGGEDTTQDTDTETDAGIDENDPHKKLKELEAEIFDQLSEEEKEVKRKELKKMYILLIEKAESIFSLTQEISKTDDTVKVVDYVSNTLMDLKTYLSDYVSTIYDSRTYLQNNVNFQKFLAIFDSIHAIFKEIKKADEYND